MNHLDILVLHMSQAKKEKRNARRQREAQLREAKQRVQDRLLLAEMATEVEEKVVYVLAPSPEEKEADAKRAAEVAAAADASAAVPTIPPIDSDEDRVELPSIASEKQQQQAGGISTRRKHSKIQWEALKLQVTEKYGASAAQLVSPHDGNAIDPFFTVRLKMEGNTVPVPFHWEKQRSFLSRQSDREEAVGIVPAEIEALGVSKIRAMKDKKANPNQVAFMTCFMTGTPLQRKTFHLHLSPPGDVFHEGKWRPKAQFIPGVLSQRLRQALGMGPNAPPPWLYSMQALRRLPPAYPAMRIPGLNAPIPSGAQWGLGQGQWGEPPRGENNAFLFPGVMDEAAGEHDHKAVYWGAVPPLQSAEPEEAARTIPQPSTAAPTPSQTRPEVSSSSSTSKKPVITPVPFQPQAYVGPSPTHGVTSTVPQEYVRVQDTTTNSTVAVSHVMVAKNAAQAASYSPPPSSAQQRAPP